MLPSASSIAGSRKGEHDQAAGDATGPCESFRAAGGVPPRPASRGLLSPPAWPLGPLPVTDKRSVRSSPALRSACQPGRRCSPRSRSLWTRIWARLSTWALSSATRDEKISAHTCAYAPGPMSQRALPHDSPKPDTHPPTKILAVRLHRGKSAWPRGSVEG